ncbi:nucleotidyltransferase family protein [archaeon]|nr:nucleotidyltransferase family protein [archaeon]
MVREIVSLNLDGGLLGAVDSLVGKKYRSRSQAFEALVEKALNNSAVDTAVVLCGGKGTRLRPLTYKMPKPLVRVNGKPILEHVIDWLKSFDFENFILATGYKHEMIEDYFGDGSGFGVDIQYSKESEPLGTGGALKLASRFVDSTFLLANCDVLTNFNVHDMIETHKSNGSLATVALKPVKDPSRFGIAEIEGMRVKRFVQKPPEGKAPSNLANAGVVIIEPEALKLVPSKPHAFETELFPLLAGQNKLSGYTFTGPWVDVGIFETLDKAQDIW